MSEGEKKAKCPKCKSMDVHLMEVLTSVRSAYQSSNGIYDFHLSEYETTGRVTCECFSCGHEWKFRGFASISDFEEEEQSN